MRTPFRRLTAAGVALAAAACLSAAGQQQALRPAPADPSKTEAEAGPRAAVAGSAAPRRADPTKSLVEGPVEAAASRTAPAPTSPKVAPGLVRWHPDLATAQAAAKSSGKPVLLFQMMGRLDDRFC
jgi:hypothetical protein